MACVHNYSSTNTSLFAERRRKEARVNGADWAKVQRLYNPALVTYYRNNNYASHEIKFSTMLRRGLAKSIERHHGRFRPFMLYVQLSPAGEASSCEAPWKHRPGKYCFMIHPQDPHHFARLVDAIVAHQKFGSDVDPLTLDVEFLDRHGRRVDLRKEDPDLRLGRLIASARYDFHVVIKKLPKGERRTAGPKGVYVHVREPIASPMHEDHSKVGKNKKKKQQQQHKVMIPHGRPAISAPLEERNLPPIAVQLCEEISIGMCHAFHHRSKSARNDHRAQKKLAKKIIADPICISQAVHDAVMKDDLYKPLGAASAEEYWRAPERNMNIGQLINNIAHEVGKEMRNIRDVNMLFKKNPPTIGFDISGSSASASAAAHMFDEDTAKKLFRGTAIECSLWDRFKAWTGYYGTKDDGGNDLGPTATLSLARAYRCGPYLAPDAPPVCPPVHARFYATSPTPVQQQGEEDLFEEVSGPSGPTTRETVIMRRPKDHHHHHHHGVPNRHQHHCRGSETEYSSSSDDQDEEALLSRAQRARRGFRSGDGSSSCSSGSDVGEYISRGKGLTLAVPTEPVAMTLVLDQNRHSNFLKVFRKAYPTPDTSRDFSLVMIPTNDVFTVEKLNAVTRAVELRQKTYVDFVNHYIVTVKSFAVLEQQTTQLRFVSRSGDTIFEIRHPEKSLIVKETERTKLPTYSPFLRISQHVHHCPGCPQNVGFVTIHVLHTSLPRR